VVYRLGGRPWLRDGGGGAVSEQQPVSTDGFSALFQWANEHGVHGMARPTELERQGWVKVRQHPNYPLSWLMKKDVG
jgi:hypothetical protein